MDQQPQAAQRALPLEPGHEVVRQLDPLERLPEHELARMEDERFVVVDGQQLRQVGLGRPDIDVRVAVVAEDAKRAIKMEVDRRRLEVLWVVWLDRDAAVIERRADIAVGQDTHATCCPSPFSA